MVSNGSEDSSSGSGTILDSFTSAFKMSEDIMPPNGKITIHQKSLFLIWLTATILMFMRMCLKYFMPSRYHPPFGNAGPSKGTTSNTQAEALEIAEKAISADSKITINPESSEISKQLNSTQEKILPSQAPTRPTFDVFLRSIFIFGLIIYYIFLCDYLHYFPKAQRTYSRDLLLLLMLILVLTGCKFTCYKTNGKLLNRYQTEEWKGWMQVLFVWYHYFRAVETYNAIRIFIDAYVWMTGFGNFSFFYNKRDYSIYRILKMLFRLNFLVIIVTMVTDNEYMLYYICAMHTFWFLSVYIMMRPFEGLNENRKVMAIKFLIYATTVFMIFDVPGIGEIVFTPFKFILEFRGSLHEWMFRCGLDHYAALLGMLCAYNYPNFAKFLSFFDKDQKTIKIKVINYGLKLVLCATALTVLFIWYRNVYILEKYDYNKLHPYMSFIPLLCFIFFRNISSHLRHRYIFLFAWLGKITLETYISQLHIYMQSNAKLLIVYIHGYPLMNFALATSIYLFLSYHLFQLTIIFNNYIFPREPFEIFKNGAIGALLVGSCYILSYFTSSNDDII